MCEIMTIFAAVVFTAVHFALARHGRRSQAVFTTMLMFWGAALMWSVDCVAGALEGDPLFDLSSKDALLGVVVLAAGLMVFGALSFLERLRAAKA